MRLRLASRHLTSEKQNHRAAVSRSAGSAEPAFDSRYARRPIQLRVPAVLLCPS